MCIFNYNYLNEEYVDQFLELDAAVYQSKDQVSRETLLTRLNRNPHTDIILTTNHNLIGYISLCPIDEQTFSSIVHHELSEEVIEDAVIRYDKPGRYVAYLSSIVIDKKRYPRASGQWLIRSLERHLVTLRKRGIFISKIIAKAVSISGNRILTKMKFKEIKSKIFILNLNKKNPPIFSKRSLISYTFHSVRYVSTNNHNWGFV